MDIRIVDPRDQVSEIDHPTYRVYFWTSDTRAEEFEVNGAESVGEVLRWADSRGGSRSYVVYLCLPTTDGVTLARLHGHDPTAG